MYGHHRVGFTERMRRGWQLTKVSLGVVKQDKHLLLFPVLSGIGLVLAVLGFGGLAAWVQLTTGIDEATGIIIFLAYYFVTFFITIYFNTALIMAVKERLDGRTPTLKGGLKGANSRIGAILGWTLVAATVGLILQVLQNLARDTRNPIGQILAQLAGFAWSVITYFVLPIIAAEGYGPFKAVKQSATTIKRTWGEALVGTFSLGVIFFIVGLVGAVALIFITITLAVHTAILIVGLLLALLWVLAVALVHTTAKQVLVAALYRYATTGHTGGVMSDQQARAAFNPDEKWEEFTDPHTGRIRGA
jgi:hypothetical protein